jgi:hypothetical protein
MPVRQIQQPPGGTHWMDTRDGAGRERRRPFDGESGAGCRRCERQPQQCVIVAGLVAGAMSVVAGEHVSVHSQKDTEDALELEELRTDDSGEHKELAAIYVGRGLDPGLARQVAYQLMANDALGAHARD